MKCGFFENVLSRAWAIHAAGDKWAGHGGPALPFEAGRVPPPGEPVKVGRTVETMGDDLAYLGLHVLVSFACALGESALPFMGSAGRRGSALPL